MLVTPLVTLNKTVSYSQRRVSYIFVGFRFTQIVTFDFSAEIKYNKVAHQGKVLNVLIAL